ncbi:MAG: hypothetical protein C4297_07945 [Gemmataceae bacterium]
MKLRHPCILRWAGLSVGLVLHLWRHTLHYRYHLAEPGVDPNDHACAGPMLYAFWHEHLLALALRPTRVPLGVLVSRHADGELIARAAQTLGFVMVRGSTRRGGTAAVRQLLRTGRTLPLAITPDGPRGPRHRVQPGVVYLACRLQLPIVAIGVACSRAWRARSWDRLLVPLPGSTLVYATAPTVRVPLSLGRTTLDTFQGLVESALHQANARAVQALAAGTAVPLRKAA